MVQRLEEWSPEVCRNNHWWFKVTFGVFAALATTMLAISTITVSAQAHLGDQVAAAAQKADAAVAEIRIKGAADTEYRMRIDNTLNELRSWMRTAADKQDRMNDSIQRLLQIQEQEQKRK